MGGMFSLQADQYKAGCMMDEMLEMWHSHMDPALEVQYICGVRNFGKIVERRWGPSRTVPIMSVCSGCGIAEKALDCLVRYYAHRYDVSFKWETISMCEKELDKMQFLKEQHPDVPWMVRTMQELQSDMVVNQRAVDAGKQIFPVTAEVCAGFTCKSLTTLNKNSGANTGSVQRGDSDTGIGWGEVEKIIDISEPDVVTLENVLGMFRVDPITK